MTVNNRLLGLSIIHHSNQGVQYAPGEYVKEFERHEFRISTAWKGNPYNNTVMESFFKALKYEEVYNIKKFHSALGYLLSNDSEELVLIQQNNETPHQIFPTLSAQS